MTGKLHGKTIVVTGAARGLGALFCHAIADAGGTILALGRDLSLIHISEPTRR